MPSVLFKITNPQRCKFPLRDKVNHFSISPLERKIFAWIYIQNIFWKYQLIFKPVIYESRLNRFSLSVSASLLMHSFLYDLFL